MFQFGGTGTSPEYDGATILYNIPWGKNISVRNVYSVDHRWKIL